MGQREQKWPNTQNDSIFYLKFDLYTYFPLNPHKNSSVDMQSDLL